jgi:hypothetical protein
MASVLLPAALLPLPEPPLLELDWEPAVHPAAIMPAATMTPYLVRRLMPFRPYCRSVLTGRAAAGAERRDGGCPARERPSRWCDFCCFCWPEMT